MYVNRIGWALSQLTRVGALSRPSRGKYLINDGGRQVLQKFPEGITEKQLDALGADPNSVILQYVPSTGAKHATAAPWRMVGIISVARSTWLLKSDRR